MRRVRRLLVFVSPYRGRAALALVILALLVAMDLAIPRLVEHIVDEGVGKRDRGAVLGTAAVMLGISALSALLAIVQNGLSVRVGEGVARDLREAIFLAIERMSFGNLDRRKTGQLLVRLTSDVSAVKSFTQVSLRIGTRAPLMMVGSLVLMVSTSSHLALVLTPLLLFTAALIVVFAVRMEPLYRNVQQRLDRLDEILQENVAGARLVKAFVRAEHESARFEAQNAELAARSTRVLEIVSTMTPLLTMCVNLGVVIVVWVGGGLAARGALSLGQIVAFSNYLLTTMTPLVMMTLLTSTWAAGLASLTRIGEVLDEPPDVTDAKDAVALDPDAPVDVALDDVSFAYRGGGAEAALTHVSLAARPGETVAILGATGAGKSTLVALVPRYYDTTSGSVRVRGVDVRRATQDSLAALTGFVPQDTVLFSGTVADNVRYGRPDASLEEVERAARTAGAHEFISRMPDGYASRVEQRGANLSGGQKQRIAIARALLCDPRVLVLDDATSAVDVETESRIQAALAEDRERRTTLVVAQRISTVIDADRIVVLDKGRVEGVGTHAELLVASPIYREIYDSQLGGAPRDEADPEDEP
jgi:ATP-binding cassette subfamily B protein